MHPPLSAGAEVVRQYGRGTKAAKEIATWIRRAAGMPSPHGGPLAGPVAADTAGHRVRLRRARQARLDHQQGIRLVVPAGIRAVPTSRYCRRRGRATMSTTSAAAARCAPTPARPMPFHADKEMVRGDLKWYVDFDKCIRFFNETRVAASVSRSARGASRARRTNRRTAAAQSNPQRGVRGCLRPCIPAGDEPAGKRAATSKPTARSAARRRSPRRW